MSNADTVTVRILERVGDPARGAILQPGAVADLPKVWAERYIAAGSAEAVEREAPAKPKAKAGKKK